MIIPFAVSQTLANEFALPDAETLTLVGARLRWDWSARARDVPPG